VPPHCPPLVQPAAAVFLLAEMPLVLAGGAKDALLQFWQVSQTPPELPPPTVPPIQPTVWFPPPKEDEFDCREEPPAPIPDPPVYIQVPDPAAAAVEKDVSLELLFLMRTLGNCPACEWIKTMNSSVMAAADTRHIGFIIISPRKNL
jgi:hypothetical protein